MKYEGAQKSAENSTNLTLDNVKQQILQIVNAGEMLNILPEDASGEVKNVIQDNSVSMSGLISSLEVDEFINDLSFNIDEDGNLQITTVGSDEYFQTEKLKNYIATNTDLSEEEINGLISKWETKIENAINKAEKMFQEAKEQAIAYADKAADAMAKFSIAAFFALLLGVAAALVGGAIGADQLVVYENEVEIESTNPLE